jgi:hypothetical protein
MFRYRAVSDHPPLENVMAKRSRSPPAVCRVVTGPSVEGSGHSIRVRRCYGIRAVWRAEPRRGSRELQRWWVSVSSAIEFSALLFTLGRCSRGLQPVSVEMSSTVAAITHFEPPAPGMAKGASAAPARSRVPPVSVGKGATAALGTMSPAGPFELSIAIRTLEEGARRGHRNEYGGPGDQSSAEQERRFQRDQHADRDARQEHDHSNSGSSGQSSVARQWERTIPSSLSSKQGSPRLVIKRLRCCDRRATGKTNGSDIAEVDCICRESVHGWRKP